MDLKDATVQDFIDELQARGLSVTIETREAGLVSPESLQYILRGTGWGYLADELVKRFTAGVLLFKGGLAGTGIATRQWGKDSDVAELYANRGGPDA